MFKEKRAKMAKNNIVVTKAYNNNKYCFIPAW